MPETPVAEPGRPRGVKRTVVGRPLASGAMDETLLPKWLALPIFSSDALSSVAYATEAALVVLMTADAGARSAVIPISVAVAALLAIVALSYRQTVRAYEQSGGAYVVARSNLGVLPGVVAAASLLTDYVLTVAVSVSAGVLAITSAAPSLQPYTVELCVACVVLITFANLRGVREAGFAFAIPTYGFILALYALLATGVVKCAAGTCPKATTAHPIAVGAGVLSIGIVLRAFASGSSALTGVEAIANGVSAFRRPQSRNAARTLGIMATIAITLFLGVSYLAVATKATPSDSDSVLSQIARAVFPAGSSAGFAYWIVQVFTFAILVLAANTSFQGFPRLAAILARDRFFPRQFVNLGDRLVFSNGIVVLALISIALIVAFQANVNSLIHLYVVGVFTAFTLSQAGMVRYWRRRRAPGWRRAAAVNAVGATATFVVACVVVETKFLEGAWAVMAFIPVFVLAMYGIHHHYRRVARRLNAGVEALKSARPPMNRVLLDVESLDDACGRALRYARAISTTVPYRAVHLPSKASDPGIRPRWREFARDDSLLEVVEPRHGRTDSVLELVWRLPRGESTFVTVVVPERFRKRSLLEAFRHRSAFRLKLKLLREPGVAIADVPWLEGEKEQPEKLACRILVSGGNAASMRAARYAETLGIEDTRAVFFAFDADERERVEREWERTGMPVRLEALEAPYRDLREPLVGYLRSLTADPDVLVSVVMPELVVHGWRRILHNQRALYVKRLLLFEPRVILTSVPYQLG